ncbi:MAG: FAD:protein FMN transferase [Gallionellaceae bacterium]
MRFFSLLFVLLAIASCSKEPFYQEEAYVFGTRVEVSIAGTDESKARAAVAEVLHEFQRLHDLLHAWKLSEISQLNAAIAQGKSATVSAETAAMLQDATRLSVQSEGLFNPAIGGLIQLWGFQADEFKAVLPDENTVAALVKANPQMTDLIFEKNRILNKNKSISIDLGGYAKGYALDRAAAILRQKGIKNALINIGGNVLALGAHGSRSWRVGIQHPRKPGALATMELHDGEAIGTSGDYQRYFEIGDQRYCHVIDPRSGYPVTGVQAVTIVTKGEHAGLLSDAASKPLFISGAQGWRLAAQRMGLAEALLIDAAGVVHLTADLQKRLEFTNQSTVRKIEL